MKYKIIDGNEACALSSYNFTEVAGIYPITPSSSIPELIDLMSGKMQKNFFDNVTKVVEMQSEAGVAGMIHGSLQNGCLASTYTSSQGLLLMIPNMYKMAGELLPCVINVAARSISTHALSIFCDHQDIYSVRQTGFAILASSSQQEVMDLTNVVYLSAIKSSLPFVNFFDGFRTSHELQKVRVMNYDKVKNLIDTKALEKFRNRSIDIDNPKTIGTNQNDDIYFQNMEAKNIFYDKLPDIVNKYMEEINKINNTNYKPFNYYGVKNAKYVVVAMGSINNTIKETIDYLIELGYKVGLIEVHLYRPFSSKYFLKSLPKTTEKIAVLDRSKEHGSSGEALYLDVASIIKEMSFEIEVIGGRYGLSGKNTTPAMIKSVYDNLINDNSVNHFSIGIEDDVTNKSLPYFDIDLNLKQKEFLIYGFGSDGMVSASKDIIKIVGGANDSFVQGYFQYDSKKSGGTTISHLRFCKSNIKSSYYIEKADLIACTKDSYLTKYNMITKLKKNAIFILNTNKNVNEINSIISNDEKKHLYDYNIKFYVIDANKLASEQEIDGKVSIVMESVIFKLGKILKLEYAISSMKNNIKQKFKNKTGKLIDKNINLINKAIENIVEIDINDFSYTENNDNKNNFFTKLNNLEGNDLRVSDFLKNIDGRFDAGLSKLNKGFISDIAPVFNKENCIQCNLCSIVCPHAVIRPFLLNDEEYRLAPKSIKDNCIDVVIKSEKFKYIISSSIPDCTGCNLCVNVCPGLKGNKALSMEKIKDIYTKEKEEEINYLFKKVSEKRIMPISTVKGSQFRKPKFEFSGACKGCGETPYLKLLTQLFGDNIVMANATGCSSIYGGMLPSTPYSVPWLSSLFEDNAEFGLGMKIADNLQKESICHEIKSNLNKIDKDELEIYQNYLNDISIDNSNRLYDIIDNTKIEKLKELKKYIKKKIYFIVGGDGWAYDIGFPGIDHVLASGEDVNIFILDTEVYSNTGGQTSKATKIGGVAKFSSSGKKTYSKDIMKIALTYLNVYVGSIALGGNMQHTVKTIIEAENYKGVSIINAYSPCIEHKIIGGMEKMIEEQKQAVECGYYLLFHYNPDTKVFKMDSKPDFDKYFSFIENEDRYKILKKINPEKYMELLEKNKEEALNRYNYYLNLEQISKKNSDI